MAHQMTQGAIWPSSVIGFGPQWRNSKITWTNFIHTVLDVKLHNKVTIFNIVGAVKNTVAHPWLGLSQCSPS